MLSWSAVVGMERVGRLVAHEQTSNTAGVYYEYLRALVAAGECYSMSVESPTPQGGAPARHDVHFQYLDCAYGSSRAHYIHTVSSADDVSLTASMAFLIQPQTCRDRMEGEEPLPSGAVEVTSDAEPQWVTPESIASFQDFVNGLMRCSKVEDGTVTGSLVLSGIERVKIRTLCLTTVARSTLSPTT